MGNAVYVNGREVSCKAGDGKALCGFPDVCLSPPSPPAGPVPVPYPVTAMDTDTSQGSKHVKVNGKELMLKNQSSFKKCSGDEAATKSLGMGVVTHQIGGKVYFTSWSFDVKVEGVNAVRHLDLVTLNHMSMPGNTPTWPYLSKQTVTKEQGPCKNEIKEEKKACGGKTADQKCKDKKCQQAMKCQLVPYKAESGQAGCCPGQTPHHLIEVHCFTKAGERASGGREAGFTKYDDKKAPCVCCDESSRYKGDHGTCHAVQGVWERSHMDENGPRSQMGGDGSWTYKQAKEGAKKSMAEAFPASGCAAECIEAQLDAYHEQVGCKDDKKVRADRSPLTKAQKAEGEAALKKMSSGAGGGGAGGS